MSLSKQFKTDNTLETKGIVIDYGETRIRIARAGGANKTYLQALERETKPHRKAIMGGFFDTERSNKIIRDIFAKHVVLDWEVSVDGKWKRGISPEDAGEKGKDLLPVSAENVVKVFENLPDLFADLSQQANSNALFRAEIAEELAGKS